MFVRSYKFQAQSESECPAMIELVSNGYQRPKLSVSLTYLIILLTTVRRDYLGASGYLAHIPTLKAMPSLLVVRYIRLPIMLLYSLVSTSTLVGSMVTLLLVHIKVLASLKHWSPNLDIKSLSNIDWFTNMPFSVCHICRLGNNLSFPSILISKSDFMD